MRVIRFALIRGAVRARFRFELFGSETSQFQMFRSAAVRCKEPAHTGNLSLEVLGPMKVLNRVDRDPTGIPARAQVSAYAPIRPHCSFQKKTFALSH